ncbi:cation exporting V-type ATPase, subunit D [Alteracholeplasma palmae J233]|uniref:V-type ATP synthase subunit D n=1 Tax=Alteracholeplasma palmae (strain ATCC 49389 / J233) TaxID=1318466 RepID=U4KRB3_ALTPJ|nr:V-type ATP synthase subunit D [Alteracholeplasma palmae]CCV64011.1 cation exporting V-type ATPase, subunit D [Alteracholeplasma palmae J233]
MNSQIIPTKGNLLNIKKSYQLAKLGQDLMERKKNILMREMMSLLDDVAKIRDEISETYKRAYRLLQDANITLGIVGDIAKAVPIDNGLEVSYMSVMGVDIPKIHHEKPQIKLSYGLSATNSKFDQAFKAFQDVKVLTIKLAEIDNSAYRLANGIRKSQKRANALKNIVMPDLEYKVKFIGNVLEEREREEFSRMKVIKNRK